MAHILCEIFFGACFIFIGLVISFKVGKYRTDNIMVVCCLVAATLTMVFGIALLNDASKRDVMECHSVQVDTLITKRSSGMDTTYVLKDE